MDVAEKLFELGKNGLSEIIYRKFCFFEVFREKNLFQAIDFIANLWYNKRKISGASAMSIFKRKPKEGTLAFREEMAKKIAGKHIKYVTERENGQEIVIGKEGSLCLRDGELLVYASMDVIFRCPVAELTASELMSLDGVILTGPDGTHDGALRAVIAYYLYYR